MSFFEDYEEWTSLILTLPQLKSYKCLVHDGFPLVDLPETNHLTELHVMVSDEDPIFTGFFRAVKKVIQLEKLIIDCYHDIKEQGLLLLVCGVAVAATSLGKDVLVTHFDSKKNAKRLRITRSETLEAAEIFEEDCKTLQLSFKFKDEDTLFKGVTEFVRNKIQGYRAFVLKNKK